MGENGKLVRNSLLPFVIGDTENVYGNSAAEINIFFSVAVLENRSLAADKLNGESCIGVGNELLIV